MRARFGPGRVVYCCYPAHPVPARMRLELLAFRSRGEDERQSQNSLEHGISSPAECRIGADPFTLERCPPDRLRFSASKRREATGLMQHVDLDKTSSPHQIQLIGKRTRRVFLLDIGKNAVPI